MRMFVAILNAATCEHISPAIYTSTLSTANKTAIQPSRSSPTAWEKSGCTRSTSRMMRHMYQNGTSAISALSALSTHEA